MTRKKRWVLLLDDHDLPTKLAKIGQRMKPRASAQDVARMLLEEYVRKEGKK